MIYFSELLMSITTFIFMEKNLRFMVTELINTEQKLFEKQTFWESPFLTIFLTKNLLTSWESNFWRIFLSFLSSLLINHDLTKHCFTFYSTLCFFQFSQLNQTFRLNKKGKVDGCALSIAWKIFLIAKNGVWFSLKTVWNCFIIMEICLLRRELEIPLEYALC